MYVLYNQPFLDRFDKCYKNIVTINKFPEGALSTITNRVQIPALSEFRRFDSCSTREKCGYVIQSFKHPSHFLTIDEIPELFAFLHCNGYSIDTKITKMMVGGNVNYTNSNDGEIVCFFYLHKNEFTIKNE
jgi:hypothetical protein